jgi:hypothetical protein
MTCHPGTVEDIRRTRYGRWASALGVLLLASGASVVGANPVSASGEPAAMLVNCPGFPPVMSPTNIQATCEHAGTWIYGIKWSSWGRTTAAGSGLVEEATTCTEGSSCALPTYRVPLTLSGVRRVGALRRYLRMDLGSPVNRSYVFATRDGRPYPAGATALHGGRPPFVVVAPAVPRILLCTGVAAYEPHQLYWCTSACSGYVSHIHWTSWTSTAATGVGTERTNNGLPNCGNGTWTSHPGYTFSFTHPRRKPVCVDGAVSIRVLFSAGTYWSHGSPDYQSPCPSGYPEPNLWG